MSDDGAILSGKQTTNPSSSQLRSWLLVDPIYVYNSPNIHSQAACRSTPVRIVQDPPPYLHQETSHLLPYVALEAKSIFISFTCNTHLERETAIFLFMAIRSDNLPREVWLLFHGRLGAWHCPEAVHMTWGRSLTIEVSLATWDYWRKMEILLAMTSNVTQREDLSHVCFPVSMERGGKTTCFPPTIVLFIGG